MENRWLVRRLWMPGGVTLMAVATLAGCAQVLGIDDLPDDVAVRGTAIGVLGPVALELRLGSDVELLAVAAEGPFAFKTPLADGASYTVVLVDPTMPCTLRNQTGMIEGAGPNVELTCTGASLASVLVSGVEPATITIVPGTTTYEVELSLLQQSATLTATVATDGDKLTVAGTPVASGAPAAEIPLSLGENPVDIVVENELGWERIYRVTLRRAAKIAQYAYGKASNAGVDDRFGTTVALSGDTLVVGAPQESSAATGVGGNQSDNSARSSGAVYVFRRTGTTWQQEAYLKASNTDVDDAFGSSVAISGDTLAVGASKEDSAAGGIDGDQGNEPLGTDSGAVYVFRRTGTTWQQEVYLKASNPEYLDWFGGSVALSGDTLAVGAHGDGDDGGGAVYVFHRTGTAWQQEAYLRASNTEASDDFGASMAFSGDTLVVGAPQESSAATGVGGNQGDNSARSSGAVYVFRRTGTTWQQEAYLKASNTGADDRFGFRVALSGDTLAVGADQEDSAAQGVGGNQGDEPLGEGSGAVYVFRRTGTTWQQEAYLKASNTEEDDSFGISVALSGDTLAVGAWGEDSAATGVGGDQGDNSAHYSGAVYVFRHTGTTWQQEAYLKASNTEGGDNFGTSVALSADTLAVGARREDSAATGVGGNQDDRRARDSGAAYIFH